MEEKKRYCKMSRRTKKFQLCDFDQKFVEIMRNHLFNIFFNIGNINDDRFWLEFRESYISSNIKRDRRFPVFKPEHGGKSRKFEGYNFLSFGFSEAMPVVVEDEEIIVWPSQYNQDDEYHTFLQFIAFLSDVSGSDVGRELLPYSEEFGKLRNFNSFARFILEIFQEKSCSAPGKPCSVSSRSYSALRHPEIKKVTCECSGLLVLKSSADEKYKAVPRRKGKTPR